MMANDPMRAQRIDFYHKWSSQASEQALAADHPGATTRCAHSAGVWTLIADAIEADNLDEVQRLTKNLLLVKNGCLVAPA